jgi:hypothetical protein
MSTHTPGPWHTGCITDKTSTCNCSYIFSDINMGSIATVNYSKNETIEEGDNPLIDEAIANSRLIAASPDLLLHGKHLAVKLAEVYRASGVKPAECQAIQDWMTTVAKVEGKA